MCGSLHLLSNKLLPGTTSLPVSYNGILIDTHLKYGTVPSVMSGAGESKGRRATCVVHGC